MFMPFAIKNNPGVYLLAGQNQPQRLADALTHNKEDFEMTFHTLQRYRQQELKRI